MSTEIHFQHVHTLAMRLPEIDQLMKFITSLLLSFFFGMSCNTGTREDNVSAGIAPETRMEFESTKWKEKKDRDYPHRAAMLDDLVDNEKLKKLKRDEVINMLGEPDRSDTLYLFYRVAQKRLYSWPIHTTTLVIKFKEDSTVHWVKIHQ
jgi:hypothetical protein